MRRRLAVQPVCFSLPSIYMGFLAFTIKPNIPARLKPLEELAHNLWISWNFEAIMLFMRLDYDAWIASRQSPVRMLGLVPQEKLEQAARDDSYLAAMDAVWRKFQRYAGAEHGVRRHRELVVGHMLGPQPLHARQLGLEVGHLLPRQAEDKVDDGLPY